MYEPGSHRPLALVEGNARKNQKTRTFWYQNDHLGTPHSLTDSLGSLVYSCTYNAYGQVQTETQHQQEEHELRVETNLRFQGQYADEETGLFYNLNRYYDPALGRYLTADPIKLAGGLNQYAYVDGNPVSWIDPLGLFKQSSTGFENSSASTGEPKLPTSSGGTGKNYDKADGQGVYVLRDENSDVKYVGRGDAEARTTTHSRSDDKHELEAEILWENNLSKEQAKALEQSLMDYYGGAKSQDKNTPLLNVIRSYSDKNPNAASYDIKLYPNLFRTTLEILGETPK
ncbi:RHS repeat-associated core domain-containing protein [Budvicia aquatica]|uniref:RHS repeat-associated core domain-containing protein n=1 Tax=Budvicia aquatica TaxID=82979 RepID=UPI0003F4DB66|nr:RHS repeat-associated core domain-containing protein [Budvicia aquatica]